MVFGNGVKNVKAAAYNDARTVHYLLKMCPIFVGSVHNFGKSDNDIIYYLVKMYLFPIDALVV